MLWQDREGTWHSTHSPVDIKIEDSMREWHLKNAMKNAERLMDERVRSGDALFDEIFGG